MVILGVGHLLAIIVDAANVMGSRPDGWWRDRAGAAVRLYDDLVRLAEHGVVVPGALHDAGSGPLGTEFVLVLEGAARAAMDRISAAADDGVPADKHIRVIAANGSGDDAIVSAVRELAGRCVVVTADRELRRRCEALGASILGPRWLLGEFRH